MVSIPGKKKPGPRVARLRRRRIWLLRLLIVSLLITGSLPILALIYMPPIYHRLMMQRLTSPNLEHREQALNYLLVRGPEDEKLVRFAAGRLDEAADDVFEAIKGALDQLGRWQRPPVSDQAWLRWLNNLAQSDETNARLFVATRLGLETDLIGNEAVEPLWQQLSEDASEAVRYEMVFATARWLRHDPDAVIPQVLLTAKIGDQSPRVSRDAAILTGHVQPWVTGFQARPAAAPPGTGMAMVWTGITTNPDRAGMAINLALDESVPVRLRATAAWAALKSEDPDADGLLPAFLDRVDGRLEEVPAELLWVLLRFSRDDEQADQQVRQWLLEFEADESSWRRLRGPLWGLAHHRPLLFLELARHPSIRATLEHEGPESEPQREEPSDHDSDADSGDTSGAASGGRLAERWVMDAIAWQAAKESGLLPPDVEALLPESLRFVAAGEPWLLARAQGREKLTPGDLWPLLVSPISTYRDQAALLAAQRLSPEQNQQLIRHLLVDLSEPARFSGAVLSGLTGIRPTMRLDGREEDLLRLRLQSARDTRQGMQQRMMELGLWMQGAVEIDPLRFSAWLLGDQMPRSTVLMTLLQRNDLRALEHLFDLQHPMDLPRSALDLRSPETRRRQEMEWTGEQGSASTVDAESLALTDLLIRFRWLSVLERHLHPSAPRPDLWTDLWLAEFQIELLRYWFLVAPEPFMPAGDPRVRMPRDAASGSTPADRSAASP